MFFRRRATDAGSAAFDYYRHELAAWHRFLRLPLGISLIVGCACAVPLWLYAPRGEFLAGLFVGSVYGTAFWIWDDPPEFIAKWKQGADGERKTGDILKRLEKDGWRSVHGRQARFGDLDHIAVGPGGIFLLNTKNLAGSITVEVDGLTASYRDSPRRSFTHTKLAPTMRGDAKHLKERIRAVTGLTYWVQPVVVIWGDFDSSEIQHDGIAYLEGRRLRDWLQNQPHRLSRRDAELIQLGLEAEMIVPRAAPLVPTAEPNQLGGSLTAS
jgi:hypothetical protein